MGQSGFWEKLKDFSTIAAGAGVVLYVLGYTIHVVHYFHVLGIEIPFQPLEYIRTGGDFGASILISTPQLFSHGRDYFPSLFQGDSLTIATILIILFYLGFLLAIIVQRKSTRSGWSKWPFSLIGIFLISSLILLVWQEYQLLAVKDVLQTFDLTKVKEAQANIGENSKEPLNIRLARIEVIYSDYADNGGKTQAFERWKDWYNLKATKNPKQSRLSFYLALLFLNIIVVIAVWLYRWALTKRLPPEQHKYLTYGSVFLSLILLMFFSFAYAIVGKSYDYPIVTLRLTSKDRDESSKASIEKQDASGDEAVVKKQTHPVYLVSQTDAGFIVYDRLDFLKVKYIPRSRVDGINQLFVASPFENCSTKSVFMPCEAAWGRDDLWIEDF